MTIAEPSETALCSLLGECKFKIWQDALCLVCQEEHGRIHGYFWGIGT